MDVIFVIITIIALATMQIRFWSARLPDANTGYLWAMFVMHYLLTAVYILYAFATRSDSFEYYHKSVEAIEWMELWGTGTPFIRWLTYPFSNVLGLSFVSCMLLFSYLGFLASGYWYMCIRENVQDMPPIFQNLSWLQIVMLLPNTHFWSSSIGKGAVMYLGIALFVYGLSRFNRRIIFMVIGLLITFLIRPHLTLVMAMGTGLGVVMAGKALPWYARIGLTLVAGAMAAFFFQGSMEFTGVDENQLGQFLDHRTRELGKADSGVDISNYSLPMKLFTFWCRPLFVDAPGAFGYIVSFENLLYFYMLFIVAVRGFRSFGSWNGWFKACLFIFLLASIILAQVSGNLGIAMRQKAQIMPLFFIAFLKAQEFVYRKNAMQSSALNYA